MAAAESVRASVKGAGRMVVGSNLNESLCLTNPKIKNIYISFVRTT